MVDIRGKHWENLDILTVWVFFLIFFICFSKRSSLDKIKDMNKLLFMCIIQHCPASCFKLGFFPWLCNNNLPSESKMKCQCLFLEASCPRFIYLFLITWNLQMLSCNFTFQSQNKRRLLEYNCIYCTCSQFKLGVMKITRWQRIAAIKWKSPAFMNSF